MKNQETTFMGQNMSTLLLLVTTWSRRSLTALEKLKVAQSWELFIEPDHDRARKDISPSTDEKFGLQVIPLTHIPQVLSTSIEQVFNVSVYQ